MRRLGYNTSNLINDLLVLIPEIEEKLTHRMNGVDGDGSVKQLKLIRDELIQILEFAKKDQIPVKSMRYTAFSRFVADEWSIDSVLGKKLCLFAEKYRRL